MASSSDGAVSRASTSRKRHGSNDLSDCSNKKRIALERFEYVNNTLGNSLAIDSELCNAIEDSPLTAEECGVLSVSDKPFEDSSGYSGDDSSSNIMKVNYFQCLMCNEVNSNPHFRYCRKCFKLRKTNLPLRPRFKRRQTRSNDWTDSGLGHSELLELSEETLNDDLCQICMVKPIDSAFCHKTTMHAYSCYKCSVKAYKHTGRCPVCNIKAYQVTKVIYV